MFFQTCTSSKNSPSLTLSGHPLPDGGGGVEVRLQNGPDGGGIYGGDPSMSGWAMGDGGVWQAAIIELSTEPLPTHRDAPTLNETLGSWEVPRIL